VSKAFGEDLSKFSADEFCAAQNRLFTIEFQPLALNDKP
jgi:hypothetical protein